MEPGRQPPIVWIVILNWNGLADTLECLRSIDRQRYDNAHVVVVDNGSDRREADAIVASGLASTLLRLRRNVGFAAGSNIGIRHALEHGAEYVWLLNNDTVVEPECLSTLVQVAESDRLIGLLSPVIYDYASPHTVTFSGTLIDFDRLERTHLKSAADATEANNRGTLALWGTALLIKRALVECIGLLDERYFAYVEDMDYSARAWKGGFTTSVVTNAAVFHKEGRSLGGVTSPLREYLLARNFYLFWSTHLTGRRRCGYRARYLSWVLARALAARDNPVAATQNLNGAWDALRGHWGSWEQKRAMPERLRSFVDIWVLDWHPNFWIRLLAGDVRGVSVEVLRRLRRSAGS